MEEVREIIEPIVEDYESFISNTVSDYEKMLRGGAIIELIASCKVDKVSGPSDDSDQVHLDNQLFLEQLAKRNKKRSQIFLKNQNFLHNLRRNRNWALHRKKRKNIKKPNPVDYRLIDKIIYDHIYDFLKEDIGSNPPLSLSKYSNVNHKKLLEVLKLTIEPSDSNIKSDRQKSNPKSTLKPHQKSKIKYETNNEQRNKRNVPSLQESPKTKNTSKGREGNSFTTQDSNPKDSQVGDPKTIQAEPQSKKRDNSGQTKAPINLPESFEILQIIGKHINLTTIKAVVVFSIVLVAIDFTFSLFDNPDNSDSQYNDQAKRITQEEDENPVTSSSASSERQFESIDTGIKKDHETELISEEKKNKRLIISGPELLGYHELKHRTKAGYEFFDNHEGVFYCQSNYADTIEWAWFTWSLGNDNTLKLIMEQGNEVELFYIKKRELNEIRLQNEARTQTIKLSRQTRPPYLQPLAQRRFGSTSVVSNARQRSVSENATTQNDLLSRMRLMFSLELNRHFESNTLQKMNIRFINANSYEDIISSQMLSLRELYERLDIQKAKQCLNVEENSYLKFWCYSEKEIELRPLQKNFAGLSRNFSFKDFEKKIIRRNNGYDRTKINEIPHYQIIVMIEPGEYIAKIYNVNLGERSTLFYKFKVVVPPRRILKIWVDENLQVRDDISIFPYGRGSITSKVIAEFAR